LANDGEKQGTPSARSASISRELCPRSGLDAWNFGDFSFKRMTAHTRTRPALGKIDQLVAYLTRRNRTPKYTLLSWPVTEP
jgi:hypothetical protein